MDTKKSGTAVIPSLCAWRKGRFLLPKISEAGGNKDEL